MGKLLPGSLSFTGQSFSRKKIASFLCGAVVLLLLLFSAGLARAQAPGPVAAPAVWLRADRGAEYPGRWSDAQGGDRPATASSTEAPALTGSLNFNPALAFDGIDDHLQVPYSLEHLSGLTLMAVYQAADTTERGIWGAEQAQARPVLLTTGRAAGPGQVTDKYSRSGPAAALNTVTQLWAEATPPAEGAFLALGSAGRGQSWLPFKGLLAEFLVFDRVLGFMERLQAETYLAIKYGITLINSNYVSSAEQVLWQAEENAGFGHRITGIGRDDAFGLYQKQARSAADTAGLLVLSAGPAAVSNAANKTTINNLDFLVWGDNDGALTAQPGEGADSLLALLGRRWLLDATGATAGQLPVQLQLNTAGLPPSPRGYWLVIDRSGRGDFAADRLEYVLADSVSRAGIAYFAGIHWDRDGSGADQFSFARARNLLAVANKLEQPTCAAPSGGRAALTVIGGQAPYRYTLTSPGGLTRQWTGDARASQENLPAGHYTLQIQDAAGERAARAFTLELPGTLAIDLGEDRQLPPGGSLELDATAGIPDTAAVTYQWSSNFGFRSSQGKVQVSGSGEYQVTVTNRQGCVFTDKVIVSGPYAQQFKVYPNLIANGGSYQIGVSLKQAGPVRIRILDMKGILLEEIRDEGRSEYLFKGAMQHPGMYLVVLQTANGQETRKIVVH